MNETCEMRRDVGRFNLCYRWNEDRERGEIVLTSRQARLRAVHSSVNIVGDDGDIEGVSPITPDIARHVFAVFERRGDTESFNIPRRELEQGAPAAVARPRAEAAAVRHADTVQEQSFTATGGKLAHHWPIFRKLAETGYGSLIRATLTNHQSCTSRCPYCSTISRNQADAVTLDEAKAFVTALYDEQAAYNREKFPQYNAMYRAQTGSDIRLRGLILSGGGQPNLWPHFADLVRWLAKRDIDLGLITNGFPKHVPEDVYNHFRWIRVSITPEDASPHYVDGRFDHQYFPATVLNNPHVTVGLSYVYGPWTDDDILRRIAACAEDGGFEYARLLTDCNLPRDSQLAAHRHLAERLHRLGYIDEAGNPLAKLFHQLKFHGDHAHAARLWDTGQCFLQSYNVFWDTTGHSEQGWSHCYPCDSITVLADQDEEGAVVQSERRFNGAKWGTVPNTEVSRLYTEPLRPYFDPRKNCGSCLFMRNNATVKRLLGIKDWDAVHVPEGVKHRNFP